MSTNTLRIEVLTSGFFYFLAGFFLTLKLFGVYDLSFIIQLKDYLIYISIGVIAISYVLGMMAHRLIPLLISKPLRSVRR